jgi:hypothetical protein
VAWLPRDKRGRLEHGFLRVRCEDCHADKLVAFSSKRRGISPFCGAAPALEKNRIDLQKAMPAEPRARPRTNEVTTKVEPKPYCERPSASVSH